MQVKINELKNVKYHSTNFYLFYGPNTGLIEETINKVFKPFFTNNIIRYDENELLGNIHSFKEMIFNKSFFDDDKFIIINRASNKILDLIEELINSHIEEVKIIIKAGMLDKKSKLRSYFEKHKSTVATAFYEDNYQSLLLTVKKIFKEKKVNVSNEIINLIIERAKGDRINIYNEINKILSFAEKKNKIELEDVLKLTNLAENYSYSELVDQNLLKNKKRTINILNENSQSIEENILILRTFLTKLKRLKKLKIDLQKTKNIEQVLSSSRPPIFWKDKDIIRQQLNILSISEIKYLIQRANNLELEIKKNNQISNQILNNFILENLISVNNAV